MWRFLSIAKNKKGYLLFEVMLAVAILSLGLVMLLRCFAGPLKALKVSENHLKAALLMEQKIEELQTRPQRHWQAETGTFPDYSGQFKWRVETSRGVNASWENEKLTEAKLTVFWKEGKKERSIHLTSLMVQK